MDIYHFWFIGAVTECRCPEMDDLQPSLSRCLVTSVAIDNFLPLLV